MRFDLAACARSSSYVTLIHATLPHCSCVSAGVGVPRLHWFVAVHARGAGPAYVAGRSGAERMSVTNDMVRARTAWGGDALGPVLGPDPKRVRRERAARNPLAGPEQYQRSSF